MTGRHIQTGVITFRRGGDSAQEYYVVRLTDVVVDAIEQVDPLAEPGIDEQVSLKARQFRFSFRPQRPNGQLGPEQTFDWDCVSNSRV